MAVIHFYLYCLMRKLLLFESLISGFEILSCKKDTNEPISPLQRIHRQSITKCLKISPNYLKCDQGLNVISENNR